MNQWCNIKQEPHCLEVKKEEKKPKKEETEGNNLLFNNFYMYRKKMGGKYSWNWGLNRPKKRKSRRKTKKFAKKQGFWGKLFCDRAEVRKFNTPRRDVKFY